MLRLCCLNAHALAGLRSCGTATNGALLALSRGGALTFNARHTLACGRVACVYEKTAELYVSQAEWAHARAERADEYPCGIEILLVDGEGNVAALPRTTRIENTFTCLGGRKGEVA